MTPEEREAVASDLSDHLGVRVVIDDAVPPNVWGFVGDFAKAFGGDEE